MKKVKGTVVSGGITIGKIYIVNKTEALVKKNSLLSAERELTRLAEALDGVGKDLLALQRKVQATTGNNEAAIFEMQALLLSDEGYRSMMEQCILTKHWTAEYAVEQVGAQYADKFAALEDAYMCERAADMKELTARLINTLQGNTAGSPVEQSVSTSTENVMDGEEISSDIIYVAEDFTAGFIAERAGNIGALVSTKGSPFAHAAILAKGMEIPMLVQADVDFATFTENTADGEESGVGDVWEAIVDAETGELILSPDEECKIEAVRKMEALAEKQCLLAAYKGKETVTKSGRKIELFANAGSVEDVKAALANDAEGIGLFRSEYLFMGRDTLPDEEEQFAVYKQIAEACGNKKAIIRTVDLGADKQAACFALDKEENPAMGYRGIRICFDRPDIFKTQLRAIYRAAAYGNLAVMYPMIVSAEEVEAIRQLSAEVKAELTSDGLPYKDIEEGIMVETPAAVLISDRLAEMVDFFSIGTNDLTQYTLAADRQNAKLAGLYNPRHEAVLRMIRMVVENAHAAGKKVGICGELAADEKMTKTLVEMGVDELSVAPTDVLGLRRIVREMEQQKNLNEFNSVTQKVKPENQNQQHNVRKEGIQPINQKR